MKYARIDRLSNPERIRSIHENAEPITGDIKQENGLPVLVPYTENERPTDYDPETQRIERTTTITAESASRMWAVVDLTPEEIEARAEARRREIESRPVDDLIRRKLRAETDFDAIPAEDAPLYAPLYPQWRPGTPVKEGEVLAHGERTLLRARADHTADTRTGPDDGKTYDKVDAPDPLSPITRLPITHHPWPG